MRYVQFGKRPVYLSVRNRLIRVLKLMVLYVVFGVCAGFGLLLVDNFVEAQRNESYRLILK
jgi:hypothetical protein